MAESVKDVPETVTNDAINESPEAITAATETDNSASQDMELEPATSDGTQNGNKRDREDSEDNGGDKRHKVDKSVEEKRLEEKEKVPVTVGPKSFGSSVEIFDHFYKLLHSWTPNLNLNKYEYLMLADLLKKGHLEPEKKIGSGIQGFQVRYHPQFKSRCFFIIRNDDSVDDFSFRKCVDHILPLPENMQVKPDVNKALGGGSGGRGGGRGRRGRGGKSKN